MKEPYNWWTDPKNKEFVDQVSWWDWPATQCTAELPISCVQDGSLGVWVACTNEKTKEWLGDLLHGTAQGKTKEEAIKKLFGLIKFVAEYDHERALRYQRWVPFRAGDWRGIGSKWIVIFGIHIYFRYGKNMKGGWAQYRRYKENKQNK